MGNHAATVPVVDEAEPAPHGAERGFAKLDFELNDYPGAVKASLFGGFAFGLYMVLLYGALKTTSVADVTIIGALQPALILLGQLVPGLGLVAAQNHGHALRFRQPGDRGIDRFLQLLFEQGSIR